MHVHVCVCIQYFSEKIGKILLIIITLRDEGGDGKGNTVFTFIKNKTVKEIHLTD